MMPLIRLFIILEVSWVHDGPGNPSTMGLDLIVIFNTVFIKPDKFDV